MSEFVTHKVEVTTVYGGKSDKAYHFVHGNTASHSHIIVAHHHVPVHFLVYKTENHCFVTHESLVVTFHV